MFRFKIEISGNDGGVLKLTFTQVFTSISEAGNAFLKRYESEDFAERLNRLEEYMNRHLHGERVKETDAWHRAGANRRPVRP